MISSSTNPIAVFDLETTGISIKTAKTLSVDIIKIMPNGRFSDCEEFFINPGIPIPKEATQINGITDEMIKDKPLFKDICPTLIKKFKDCDLAGYNVIKYDLPLIQNEFARCGVTDFAKDSHVIDVMKIYHKAKRGDLNSAYQFYLNKDVESAHSAKGDTIATAEILLKQIEMHELKLDGAFLAKYANQKLDHFVDDEGMFIWQDTDIVFNFGRHSGTALKEVVKSYPHYIQWILSQDFSDEVKSLLRDHA